MKQRVKTENTMSKAQVCYVITSCSGAYVQFESEKRCVKIPVENNGWKFSIICWKPKAYILKELNEYQLDKKKKNYQTMAHHYLLKASDKQKIFKAGRKEDIIDTPSELRIILFKSIKTQEKVIF